MCRMQINLQFLVYNILLLINYYEEINGQVHSVLDSFVQPFRIQQLNLARSLKATSNTKTYQRILKKSQKLQPLYDDRQFPCEKNGTRSEQRPTSVHKLRPGDIDVIGAIGDSLTAGFGAKAIDIVNVLSQDRGHSFTIGGYGTWRDTLTLPNILKEFNPRLIGYSLRTSLSIERASQFNPAEGGAVSNEMPYMSKILIKRIINDPRVNLKEHWKMITLFIGGNDFCSNMCYEPSPEKYLESHKNDLLEALRNFRDYLPRTIVNLVPAPHLQIIRNFTNRSPLCKIVNDVECPCIFGPMSIGREDFFNDFMYRWQAADLEVANLKEFDLDDFTVVVQPFILNYTFPTASDGNTDYSYLSVDCFHFSQRGHARAANNLWNNILEPVGRKSLNGYNILQIFRCPTKEEPFIFTRRNG